MKWIKSSNLVSVDTLYNYIEVDREEKEKYFKQYDDLKEDIKQNGIKEPVVLHYSNNDGYAYISEGNTRLAIAKDLGIEKIPVIVWRVDKPLNKLKQTGDFPAKKTPKDNQINQDSPRYKIYKEIKPSSIGIK